jgi:hypothetical protein
LVATNPNWILPINRVGGPPPIYLPKPDAHPFAQFMAGIGEGMKAYAEAKKEKQAREFEPEIPEDLKSQVGVVQIAPGKWQVVKKEQPKPDRQEPWKLTSQGLIYKTKKGYGIDPEIKADPNIDTIEKTDEKGNVTLIGIHKQTGETAWKKRLGKIGKKSEEVGQSVRNFELQYYGKLVPELRGTPDYVAKLEEAKRAGAVNMRIGKRTFVKDGRTYTQEYIYNPLTGKIEWEGKPYLSKREPLSDRERLVRAKIAAFTKKHGRKPTSEEEVKIRESVFQASDPFGSLRKFLGMEESSGAGTDVGIDPKGIFK